MLPERKRTYRVCVVVVVAVMVMLSGKGVADMELNGSPGWIRTNDTWINSPPL